MHSFYTVPWCWINVVRFNFLYSYICVYSNIYLSNKVNKIVKISFSHFQKWPSGGRWYNYLDCTESVYEVLPICLIHKWVPGKTDLSIEAWSPNSAAYEGLFVIWLWMSAFRHLFWFNFTKTQLSWVWNEHWTREILKKEKKKNNKREKKKELNWKRLNLKKKNNLIFKAISQEQNNNDSGSHTVSQTGIHLGKLEHRLVL